jgi:predicted DCC family thiol-disulfide oxidoreductase YuxK
MNVETLPKHKKIILFDGMCNLCDNVVQFVIRHDKKDCFRFVSLQSKLGKDILKHIGVNVSETDSIILYEPGKAYYYKSEAALKIIANLGGLVSALGIFAFLPVSTRNALYDYIAKNRYGWYGKKDSCMVPTQEISGKFL